MPDLSEIYNFLPLTEELLTSGQPTEAQFRIVSAAGVRTVVNLALPTSDHALADEAGLIRSLGMEYVHIPVVWEAPTQENFMRFAAAMDSLKGRKVLIHCAANMRVSAFVALYRITRLGWDHDRAFEDVHRIWKPEENEVWQNYIAAILDKKK